MWCERYSEILSFVLKNYVDRINQKNETTNLIWQETDLKDLDQSKKLFEVVFGFIEKISVEMIKEQYLKEVFLEYKKWILKIKQIQEQVEMLYYQDISYMKIETFQKIRIYSSFTRYGRNKARELLRALY